MIKMSMYKISLTLHMHNQRNVSKLCKIGTILIHTYWNSFIFTFNIILVYTCIGH